MNRHESRSSRLAPPFILAALLATFAVSAFANSPPSAPVIQEPGYDEQVVGGADVHMVTAPMQDPDANDEHLCSDWEIRDRDTDEIVWSASCVTAGLSVHIHLGDGTFSGSHAALRRLVAWHDFVLRVRHRDSSGDPETEWSAWSRRLFKTRGGARIDSLQLVDLSPAPSPRWIDDLTHPLRAPSGTTVLVGVESSEQTPMAFGTLTDASIEWSDEPPLHDVHPIRIRLTGDPVSAVGLPASVLDLFTVAGARAQIYLPDLAFDPGEQLCFWVNESGATAEADCDSSVPEFSRITRAAPNPWVVNGDGYVVEKLATGFQLPVGIAFVPNAATTDPDAPFLYAAELYGTIKAVSRNGRIWDYATNLLNFTVDPKFPGSGEIGTAALTVETQTGDILVSGLYWDDGDKAIYPQILRLHSEDGGRTGASRQIVFAMPKETQNASHQISNISFGPDGKLYVHLGDGFAIALAESLDSFRGKILRLNPDGTAPDDNPFFTGEGGARDYIFALGFRNPFGGCWRAADGFHYEVENGPSMDRLARVVPGTDYGWDGTDESMTIGALYVWPQAHAPVNIAFVEPETFDGSGFPESKWDRAFVTESGETWTRGSSVSGKRIVEFSIDASGNLVEGPTSFVENNGVGKSTAAGLAAGPDGLYFTDLYADMDFHNPAARGANVLRVRHVGTATFLARIESTGQDGITVQFIDTTPIRVPVSWSWRFGDGTTSVERHPRHTYARGGTYAVELTVAGSDVELSRTVAMSLTSTQGDGLAAMYFVGADMASPAFGRVDPQIDYSWQDAPPVESAEQFSARWKGWLRPRFSETYRLSVVSDGGFRVWAGETLLIDDWESGVSRERGAIIALEAGRMERIRVELRTSAPDAEIHLLWESESQDREVIPKACLFSRSRRRPLWRP